MRSSSQDSDRIKRKPISAIRRNSNRKAEQKIEIKSVVTVKNADEDQQSATEPSYESETESIKQETHESDIKEEPVNDTEEKRNTDHEIHPLQKLKSRKAPSEQKRRRINPDRNKFKVMMPTRNSVSPVRLSTTEKRKSISPKGKVRKLAADSKSLPSPTQCFSESESEIAMSKKPLRGNRYIKNTSERKAASPENIVSETSKIQTQEVDSGNELENKTVRNLNSSVFSLHDKKSTSKAHVNRSSLLSKITDINSDEKSLLEKAQKADSLRRKSFDTPRTPSPKPSLITNSDSDDDFVPKTKDTSCTQSGQRSIRTDSQASQSSKRSGKSKLITVFDGWSRTERYNLNTNKSYTVIQCGSNVSYIKAYNLNASKSPINKQNMFTSMITERRNYVSSDKELVLYGTPGVYDLKNSDSEDEL